MEVYLLSQGSYSDYRVEGVYTDKAKTEEFIRVTGDQYELETRELDVYPDEPNFDRFKTLLEDGFKCFITDMDRDGNGKCSEVQTRFGFKTQYYMAGYRETPVLVVRMWAKSEEHATKVTNEIRTRLIAENLWNKPKIMDMEPF